MKQNRISIKDKKLKELIEKGEKKDTKRKFFEILKRATSAGNN